MSQLISAKEKVAKKVTSILTLPFLCIYIIEEWLRKRRTIINMSVEITEEFLQQLQEPQSQEQAFRMLMGKYGERLYWHIRRIVVKHEDAEDVFQETCLKVFRNIDRYRGNARQLCPWLYQIATNEALQLLRRQTRFFQSIDSLAPRLTETLMAENDVEESKPEMLLQKALLTLPTAQRIAFNMRYFDEMSYEEIARVSGKSVGTLKTNYHYATERIKTFLKDQI